MNYYNIRDKAIPEGNIPVVEKYLNTLTDWEYDFDELLGAAVFHKNNIIIALLNLFIREHNIPTTKMGILQGIYYAEVRMKILRADAKGYCSSFPEFDQVDKGSYVHAYWHLFST